MLSQLYIENIAVIEKVNIDFNSGLNILTGETGAGKSIVIDALNAILGQRISKDLIRTGAASAFVSATFENLPLKVFQAVKEYGFTVDEDDKIVIQRQISLEGKSNCRINGRPAAISVLKEIGPLLINIHGQNESSELLSPDLHVTYLDSMGELSPLLEEYRTSYWEMHKIKEELKSLNMDEAQKARQIDLLTYQIEELEAADLKAGEAEALTEQRNLYLNSEKIATSLNRAYSAIQGDDELGGALQSAEEAATALQEASRYFPAITELASRVQNAVYELEDCSSELRDFSSQIEYDPSELETIETRLDMIYRLSRKYGETEEDMIQYLQKSRSELENIQLSDERRSKLQDMYVKEQNKANALALRLSQKRKETAADFVRQVKQELAFLDMPDICFEIMQNKCDLNSLGCDDIEFLISTNPGEPAKPIAKIASGGELSRIMLAIKNVLADKDEIDTLIFDEVDTGISGSAAQKVGLKLREVSKDRQVICVTHLAIIAALADKHFLIRKNVKEGKTFTDVQTLDFAGRERELARIMGGVQITELTLKNAGEMLRMAGIKN